MELAKDNPIYNRLGTVTDGLFFSFARSRVLFLLLSSFISGFSALLYQIVWQRFLGFFAGGEIVAVTIVVCSFLTGLAFGSFWGGAIADRLSAARALRQYVYCQFAIALYAFLSKWLFYDFLYVHFGSHQLNPVVLYGVVTGCLVLPTTLVGALFPLLARASSERLKGAPSKRLSTLNAINIAGSFLGACVTGWFLVGTFGYDVSLRIGSVLSLVAGALALLGGAPSEANAQENAMSSQNTKAIKSLEGLPWGWIACTFVSGFLAISLEVVWFRLLGIYLKPNAYLFTHLLSFILLGYAAGNAFGGRYATRIKNPASAFIAIQILCLLYVLGSNFLIYSTYDWWAKISGTQMLVLNAGSGLEGIMNRLVRFLGLPALLLFPPNFLLGIGFPIIQKAIQNDETKLAGRLGIILGSNLLGNISGGLLTGLFFLNVIGSTGTLRLLGTIAIVLSIAFLAVNFRNRPHWVLTIGILFLFSTTLITFAFPSTNKFFQRVHEVADGLPFFVKEDSTGVSVLRALPGYTKERSGPIFLYVNGLAEGSFPITSYHFNAGFYASLLHPNPKSVLAIGFGTGGTPLGIGMNPKTEHVHVLELISSEMDVVREILHLPQARFLRHTLEDSRYKIEIGDGRKRLMESPGQYDIIQIDAIRPQREYSGILFAREFYEVVKSKLKDDGIFVQWLATPRVKRTVLATFPYVICFRGMTFASKSPIAADVNLLANRFEEPGIWKSWTEEDKNSLLLRARLTLEAPATGDNVIEIYTPDTPRDLADLNTDMHPRDEFYLN